MKQTMDEIRENLLKENGVKKSIAKKIVTALQKYCQENEVEVTQWETKYLKDCYEATIIALDFCQKSEIIAKSDKCSFSKEEVRISFCPLSWFIVHDKQENKIIIIICYYK